MKISVKIRKIPENNRFNRKIRLTLDISSRLALLAFIPNDIMITSESSRNGCFITFECILGAEYILSVEFFDTIVCNRKWALRWEKVKIWKFRPEYWILRKNRVLKISQFHLNKAYNILLFPNCEISKWMEFLNIQMNIKHKVTENKIQKLVKWPVLTRF